MGMQNMKDGTDQLVSFTFHQMNIDEVYGIWSKTPKYVRETSFFYSYAQSVVIKSHVAEMLFGRELAQAVATSMASVCYTGVISDLVRRSTPGIDDLERSIARNIMIGSGCNPDLYDSEELAAVVDMTRAIEHRDLDIDRRLASHLPNPQALPSDIQDIILRPMTQTEALQAVRERCERDLFRGPNPLVIHNSNMIMPRESDAA